MSQRTISQILSLAQTRRIMVLGDLMLDQYTIGEAGRVSQEAPILVLKSHEQQSMLGGAANVANMLRGFAAEAAAAGVVGSDLAGEQVRRHLSEAGIDHRCVVQDLSRCTTVKQRFVGRTHGRNSSQLLRVDHECCDPIAPPVRRQLEEAISFQLDHLDAVLISDYAKGVGLPDLLRFVTEQCRQRSIPVLVDPARGADFERYRGATLIKPNRTETAESFGSPIRTIDEAIEAAVWLCRQFQMDMSVVTLDRDGMVLASADGSHCHFPTEARSVYDITGAGDMVLASLGVGLASGCTPEEAIHLANIAAGLEVEREGVAVITADEILEHIAADRRSADRRTVDRWGAGRHADTGGGESTVKCVSLEQAASLADRYRRQGKQIAFTNGCFDLLHAGHVTSLKEAAAHGDVLFVGVNADDTIRKLKGPDRPIMAEAERMAVLAALECVQHVVLFHDETPHQLLHAIRPDVLVKGGTYREDEVVGHEVVKAYGGRVAVTKVLDGLSTTNIVARVHRAA